MSEKLVFLIGSPRSGSTLLARMIGSHSLIYNRPEPHLLTPLAHLGYYAKVDKAPYDHVLAAESAREFVAALPAGEQDYIDACRAYADTLYLRLLSTKPGKLYFLDKTPAYALVLDFIVRLYPQAKYVVLTRHPLAIFSSYAESFFNGDYHEAHSYNPILERYVPAIAKFLRDRKAPTHHVVYENLVQDPARSLADIFAFIGVENEPGAVEYGNFAQTEKGLGDPTGVARHSRPTTESVDKWAVEIGRDPDRLRLCHEMISGLDPADLELWGYPTSILWRPLDEAAKATLRPSSKQFDRYKMERLLIVKLRNYARRFPIFRRVLERMRLGADVLLRE